MRTITYYADTSPLSNKSLYDSVHSILPPHRLKKIDTIVTKEEKIRSIGSELLLGHALSEIGIDRYDVWTDKNGKPFLGSCDIQFNLSHCGQRVMCSISDYAVGCDVEHIVEIPPDLARNLLHSSEYQKMMECDADISNVFFRYWTLKESFLKMIGSGLSIDPRTFSCNLGPPISMSLSADGCSPFFKEYLTDDDYQYAVCSIKGDFEKEMRFIDIEHVIPP